MKVNLKEEIENDTLLMKFILNCEECTKIAREKEFDSREVEMKMSINGVELDVLETWKGIEGQLHETIKREAKKLVKDRLENKVVEIEDKLCDLHEAVSFRCDELIETFNLEEEL